MPPESHTGSPLLPFPRTGDGGLEPHEDHARLSAFRDGVRERIGPRSFQHYFDGKTLLRLKDEEIIVGVASEFLLKWMQKQFRGDLQSVTADVLGPAARLRFEVDQSCAGLMQPGGTKATRNTPNGAGTTPSRPANQRRFAKLEAFVEGKCNELAFTAAHHVSESPAGDYNPLLLYGGVGVGKTHLLEGIYCEIRRRHRDAKVMYTTAEAFGNSFSAALRDKTLPSFRSRFRSLDVLFVDDFEFLETRKGFQQEFLHTAKQLESKGAQLVLSCDRHPRLMRKLCDELATRCLSGLVCRIEPPSDEVRCEVATRFAAQTKTQLSPDAVAHAAKKFRNIRELQGALNTLATTYRMTKAPVTLTAARRQLADLERDCHRSVKMADIEQAVCECFGLEAEQLKSPARKRSVSQPRMIAMFLIRKHMRSAYSEIGGYFGGRNHSTVISAERTVNGWLETDSAIQVAAQTRPLPEVLESLERSLRVG